VSGKEKRPLRAVPAVSLRVVAASIHQSSPVRETNVDQVSSVGVAAATAYIDGFNLYFGMKNKYGRRHLWLDVVELIRQIRPKDQIAHVRYFTAIVKNEPAAAENQLKYIEAMKAHNGSLLDVRVGRFKERTIKPCKRCGQPFQCSCPRPYRSYEEKETDVALGAMMVADAARGIGDMTLLVSADTDLVPALSALRLVDDRRPVCLALPPGNTGIARRWNAIGNVSPFFINEPALRRSQMPAIVADRVAGTTFSRPSKWS
jgi:NYN domain-containing protein